MWTKISFSFSQRVKHESWIGPNFSLSGPLSQFRPCPSNILYNRCAKNCLANRKPEGGLQKWFRKGWGEPGWWLELLQGRQVWTPQSRGWWLSSVHLLSPLLSEARPRARVGSYLRMLKHWDEISWAFKGYKMLGDSFPRAAELCHSSRFTQSLLSCLLGWVLILLKHESYRQLCLTSRTRSQVCPFNGILQHCRCGTALYCTSVDADEIVPLWCIVVAVFHQNCFKCCYSECSISRWWLRI